MTVGTGDRGQRTEGPAGTKGFLPNVCRQAGSILSRRTLAHRDIGT